MYKEHRRIIYIVFATLFIISAALELDIGEIRSDILAVISIILGFYIATMSLLFGSKLSSILYLKVDQKMTQNAELHTLLSYFQTGMIIGMITMAILLIHALLFNKSFWFRQYLLVLLSGTGLGLFVINLILMTLIFKFLKNAIIRKIQCNNKRL